jgi:protocatechuate 3,4-dioxygenase beta subunit
VKLYARHAAYALKVFDATPAPPASAKEVTVRLSRGARVEGHVLSKTGAPMPNEEVTLSVGFEVFDARTTHTDGQGLFAFPAVARGTYALILGHVGPNSSTQTKGGVNVGDDGVVTVDFQTEKDAEASGSVSGTVTMNAAPVPNAEVSAWDDRGWDHAVTGKTDAQGKYLVAGLKPGRVSVRVETTTGLAETHRVTIDAAGEEATLDFDFGRCGIEATVVGNDGRTTVSGAWVTIELAEPTTGGDAWSGVKAQLSTDGAGKFAAKGLGAGAYRVRIVGQGYAAKITDPIAVADGETKDLGLIRLPPGGALSGRVTDDRGSPVENVGVSLKDASGRNVFLFNMVTTGSDGRFAMQGLEVGSYTVRFEAKGFAPVERPATVASEGGTVDAVLARGGSVSARVEDEAGNPVEGARIELYDASGARLTKTLSIVNLFDADVSRTNASGGATIPDLAPGSYTVKAVKEGVVLAGDAPSATVAPGGTVNVKVVVKAAP